MPKLEALIRWCTDGEAGAQGQDPQELALWRDMREAFTALKARMQIDETRHNELHSLRDREEFWFALVLDHACSCRDLPAEDQPNPLKHAPTCVVRRAYGGAFKFAADPPVQQTKAWN